MTFDEYKARVQTGDFDAIDEAAMDDGITNNEYCELYAIALCLAKKIGA